MSKKQHEASRLPRVSYDMDHFLPCVICITSHSVLLYFATGCHTYNFKIVASLLAMTRNWNAISLI